MNDLRKLMFVAVLGLSALACGEEKPAAVANVGAACAGEDDCQGAADICLTTQTLSGFGVTAGGIVHYAGGLCTAACKTNADCGHAGKCPVGQAIEEADIPQEYRNAAIDVLDTASYCYQPCSTQSECRPSYQCNTIPAALTGESARSIALDFVLGTILESSISKDKYCLPAGNGAAKGDAGAADASR